MTVDVEALQATAALLLSSMLTQRKRGGGGQVELLPVLPVKEGETALSRDAWASKCVMLLRQLLAAKVKRVRRGGGREGGEDYCGRFFLHCCSRPRARMICDSFGFAEVLLRIVCGGAASSRPSPRSTSSSTARHTWPWVATLGATSSTGRQQVCSSRARSDLHTPLAGSQAARQEADGHGSRSDGNICLSSSSVVAVRQAGVGAGAVRLPVVRCGGAEGRQPAALQGPAAAHHRLARPRCASRPLLTDTHGCSGSD